MRRHHIPSSPTGTCVWTQFALATEKNKNTTNGNLDGQQQSIFDYFNKTNIFRQNV